MRRLFYKAVLVAAVLLGAAAVVNCRQLYVSESRRLVNNGEFTAERSAARLGESLKYMVEVFNREVPFVERFLKSGDRNLREKGDYLQKRTLHLGSMKDSVFINLYLAGHDWYAAGNGWTPPPDYKPYIRPWFVKAMEAKKRTVVIPPYLAPDQPFPVMAVCKLLSDGKTVLSMDVNLSNLEPMTKDMVGGESEVGFFIGPDGTIVARSGYEGGGKIREIIAKVLENGGQTFEFIDDEGKEMVFSCPVNDGWYAVVISNRDRFFTPVWHLIEWQIAVTFTIFLIACFLLDCLIRRGAPSTLEDAADERRSRHLDFIVMATITLIFGIVIWLGHRESTEHDRNLAVRNAEQTVRLAAGPFNEFLNKAEGSVEYVAKRMDERIAAGDDAKKLTRLAENLTSEFRAINGFNYKNVFAGRSSWLVNGIGWKRPKDFDPSTRQWYRRALANPARSIISPPYHAIEDDTVEITAARLMSDEDHTVAGIDILIDRLQSIVSEDVVSGDLFGMIVADNGVAMQCSGSNPFAAATVKLLSDRVMAEKGSFEMQLEGRNVTVISVPIHAGWKAVSVFDADSFADTYGSSHVHTVVLAVALFLLAVAFSFHSSRRIRAARDRSLALESLRRQLEKALDMANSSSRAKTVFLNNMSHDIRTPMNAIIGFADIAAKHVDDPAKVKDFLGKISSASDHLLALINDVLDMSRIESGKLVLTNAPESLGSILSSVVDITSGDMKAKDLSFQFDGADACKCNVVCDRTQLGRVFLNLLSNAVKYTPAGGKVSFSAKIAGNEAEGSVPFEFTVADTGIGMTPEFAASVFDPFTRERSSTVSGIQGTGLGLSITKHIVEKMGGSISFTTKKDEGSAFTVRISFKLADAKEVVSDVEKKDEWKFSADDGKRRHARILLVEDNELNREIAQEILVENGCTVDSACDGTEAVKKIESLPVESLPDLIFMDVQMPKMNGYDATRAIRALEDPARSGIPIVAMTANAFEEDRRLALDAGMDDHIAKPVKVKTLLEAINHHVRQW